MKICFHVDQNERWATCLGNIKNTLAYFEEARIEGSIVVIANSEAVQQLVAEQVDEASLHAIQAFIDRKVVVAACRNALAGNDISEDALIPGVRTVPAGIIALAEKQEEGYAYIRP